ncbi:MAG TPA: hypothetical protein VFD21_03850 [Vicinamibacterales bacterium]|nr:hypothetical protein [Vicinamibacterales bacterium]
MRGCVTTFAVLIAIWTAPRAATPRFFPDDPIQVDDDRAVDASGTQEIEGSNAYDFAENTFFSQGDTRDIRAVNVNSVDEVPDSSWFTNRIGRRAMTTAEIARGPNQLDSVNIDDWPIVREKSSGITPGYHVVDPSGQLYQVKFDPPSNPEMASAAEVIGAAIYHAVGYNVVQGYIVEVDPSRIVIAPTASTVDLSGRKRPMTRRDVDRLLARGARLPNGKYRATLSRFADGQNRGFFKYYGTRPDDPNDIHPHEHRRELRAARVFAAWLNHDDSRGINSLDMLEGPEGRRFIKHYMFDFGSIMGSGSTSPQTLRAGNEYIMEWAPGLKTLATLGLYVRPWIRTRYWEGAKSVGRFEGDVFDPVKWRPEYPNPAFGNMRADDGLWAARLVARFSDEVIRAIVAKGGYSEPGAADHIVNTLIKRRDKVLMTWLTGVNPLGDARLGTDGVLEFDNAAVSARVTSAPSRYTLRWSGFDNATNATTGTPVETTTTEPRATAPPALLGPGRRSPISGAQFVTVAIRTTHPNYPVWEMPATFTFRRVSNGWQTVGVDRVVPARRPR